MSLVDDLIKKGYLKTPRIIEAFKEIKRVDFVLEELKNEAEIDAPLPIGWGQTISQPLTVAFMFIGSGSGWQTALLAHIVGEKGKVYAVERIPALIEFSKRNIKKYGFGEKGIVEFICKDGSKGLKEAAPFDKIIAGAAGEKIPQAWKEQLKVGGRLVAPVLSSIFLLIKRSEKEFEQKEFPGFAFVPLIED